jgi:hypothetical protein
MIEVGSSHTADTAMRPEWLKLFQPEKSLHLRSWKR